MAAIIAVIKTHRVHLTFLNGLFNSCVILMGVPLVISKSPLVRVCMDDEGPAARNLAAANRGPKEINSNAITVHETQTTQYIWDCMYVIGDGLGFTVCYFFLILLLINIYNFDIFTQVTAMILKQCRLRKKDVTNSVC
jgi:hypothetical protein